MTSLQQYVKMTSQFFWHFYYHFSTSLLHKDLKLSPQNPQLNILFLKVWRYLWTYPIPDYRFRVISHMNIFFTCKNTLVIMLQVFYHPTPACLKSTFDKQKFLFICIINITVSYLEQKLVPFSWFQCSQ